MSDRLAAQTGHEVDADATKHRYRGCAFDGPPPAGGSGHAPNQEPRTARVKPDNISRGQDIDVLPDDFEAL